MWKGGEWIRQTEYENGRWAKSAAHDGNRRATQSQQRGFFTKKFRVDQGSA